MLILTTDRQQEMEDIYSTPDVSKIPWVNEEPPEQLVELVEERIVEPCKALDLGCGVGYYSIYLVSKGFEVTGVDISSRAIRLARANAFETGVDCEFVSTDLIEGTGDLRGTFDFALEWMLLHHIFPEYRKAYVENVNKLLNPGAKYLSLCFAEGDEGFEGDGKYRKTRVGTTLYFSSEEEIKELFETYFNILRLKTIVTKGTKNEHRAVYAFMEKT